MMQPHLAVPAWNSSVWHSCFRPLARRRPAVPSRNLPAVGRVGLRPGLDRRLSNRHQPAPPTR